MTDLKFQNDLIQACQASYDTSKFPIPEGYTLLETKESAPSKGFAAIVLKKDNNIVIAYRGTDEEDIQALRRTLNINYSPDIKNDLAMFVNRNLPQQSYEALALYDKCAKKYRGYNITVTGHSLGGSCANIVGALRGVEAVGFNPYGVKDLLDKTMVKYETKNITNYCNPNDIITTLNGHNQIGTIYEMKSKGKRDKFLYDHYLENQQITEQSEISKNDLDVKPGLVTEGKHIASTLNKYVEGQVESGYNRGKEYLGNILEKGAGFFNSLSSDKNERIHNFIDATFQKFNNSSFDGYRSNNGGQVYVKEYKRHDGTIVRAHWRDWPGTFDPNKKLSHMEQEELNHALDFWMDDEKYA